MKEKLLILVLFLFLNFKIVFGISLLTTPFGGKTLLYLERAPGCEPIVDAVLVATLGSVVINIAQLEILDYTSLEPKKKSLGLLSINGVPAYTVYEKYNFSTPNVHVIGNYFDLCSLIKDILEKILPSRILKNISEKVISTICDTAAEGCPINSLIYQIGTSGNPLNF